MVDVAGNAQAHSLLSNGLDPDLLICEVSSPDSSELIQYREFLNGVPAQTTCLIANLTEHTLRNEASALGVKHFLTRPVTRFDLESLIDEVSHSEGQPSASLAIDPISAKNSVSGTRKLKDGSDIPVDMPPVPYIEELDGNNFFLAASPKMLEIHRQVKLLADIDVNVLILGESGTGKEIIAQLIHKNSRRSRGEVPESQLRGAAGRLARK